eukprot:GHUV01039413.1.p3 GENE.GHUV01039413.1~~GHUV01039413.1.p3  ORF type:complete len:100 (-),score=24.10 GHUV01039413.1:232-531(-)
MYDRCVRSDDACLGLAAMLPAQMTPPCAAVCRLKTGEPIEAWCEQLVQEQGVLLLPASVYDHEASTNQGHFRFALGRKNMPKCLQQLEAWLKKKYPDCH